MKRKALWAAIAIAMGASQSAWGYAYWYGKGANRNYSTKENWWSGTKPGANDAIVLFRCTSYNIVNYTVNFDSAVSYAGSKVAIDNASTESDPFVFTTENDTHGMTTTGNIYIGSTNGTQDNRKTDGYLTIKRGTYKGAVFYLGTSENYDIGGYVTIDGSSKVSLTSTGDFNIYKGLLKFDNPNATVSCGQDLLVGSKSGSTGKVEVDNGTLTATRYFTVGNGGMGQFEVNGSTVSAANWFRVGNGGTGSVVINDGGAIVHTGSYMRLGETTTGTVTVNAGGRYENTGSNGNMTIAHGNGATGVLNVHGGEVEVKGDIYLCYGGSPTKASVNITDGGVVVTDTIHKNVAAGVGELTIDNGTIRHRGTAGKSTELIQSANGLNVYVGANGATLDSNGHDISISANLQNKSGEAGVVRFTGGGIITLSGTPSYTGGTTNVAGTTLSLTTTAKTALVTNPVAIEIPPTGVADGTTVFEINDGNGTFTQAEVDEITVTGTDVSRYSLVLADGDTKVVITDTLAGEYVWNDGASGASWRTSGKWSKNGLAGDWYDSTAAVFANAGDAVTVDADVTAASVTFRTNATVGGTALLTVPVVAVSNGVSAVINAPTAGALEKFGPGALTLGASRTAQTDITEGTLVMSGDGTTIPWVEGMLGTETGRTAIMKFENGATLASSPWNISLGQDGSVGGGVTVELYKECGDWNVRNRFTVGWNSGDAGKFYHNGGTMTVAEQFRVSSQAGSSGEFTMNDGTVTVTTNMYIGCNLDVVKGVFNMNGGTFTCNGTTYVAFSKNDYPAELHINGGTFKAAGTFIASYDRANSEAVIELNSTDGTPGVLETKGLTLGSGSATLTFHGGELKAAGDLEPTGLIQSGIAVRVGANGGIVNANGKAVSIPATIGAAGDTGGMTYKGGGTVTLSTQPAYSGKTTIEPGTTLVVPAAIAGANLAVVIPEGLPTGLYKIAAISGGGAFASDVLSSVTLPSDVNARFFLDNGDTEIWCIYSSNASDHIWIGGATGSLNDGANWLSGSVPADGTAIIGSTSAAALTNPDGSAFAATTIIVPKGSAAVTISGAKFSNMLKITNNSSDTIEFENAVEFSGNVDVVQNTGAIKFTGGATGTWLARATDIHGTYNFTGSGDRTEHGGTKVKSDGVYNLPNATFYKHNGDFHMETGGRAVVKDAKILNKDGDKKLLGTFNGEFKVAGEFLVSGGSGATWDKMPTHYTSDGGNGTFIANKIRVNQNSCIVPCKKTIMGPEGIIRGAGYVRVQNSGSHEFGSYADWTMYQNNLGNTTTDGYVIFKRDSSGSWTYLTFDTTDYYDRTIGRTITCEAPICAANAASAAKFGVTVKGIGKFVFANTSDSTIFSGGLTVTNSATVEVMADAWPGRGVVTLSGTSTLLMHTGGSARTGAVTVNSGATLKVAESGTAALGGDLTLNDGATLAFNFTEKNTAPVLDLTGKAVTLGDQKQIKVAISGERPCGGKHVLSPSWTTEDGNSATAIVAKAADCPKWVREVGVDGDGNLYAEVIMKGLTIICK